MLLCLVTTATLVFGFLGWLSEGKKLEIQFHLTLRYIFACTGVEFVREPENTDTCVGNSVFFPCEFMGSAFVPFWRINDTSYVRQTLPDEYRFHFTGLGINLVQLTMNNTKFQCIVAGMESGVGILFVRNTCKFSSFISSFRHLQYSSFFRYQQYSI